MDDLDYLFPGAGDAAYRSHDDAARHRAPGGTHAAGRNRGAGQPGTVWQRAADGPWSPLSAPVPDQLPVPQRRPRADPGFGWASVPPGSGPRPPAPPSRSQLARPEPLAWSSGEPADGHRPGHGAAYDAPPAPRRRRGRRSGNPRGRRPRRPVPDGARRPPARTSLLSTAPIVVTAEPPRLPALRPAPYARALPGWLPFGRRLVLLPKGTAGNPAAARPTGRPAVLDGLRPFAVAFLAAGLAFFIGYLVGGHA